MTGALSVPFRVALISDLAEEGWHSMDLVAEMLSGEIAREHGTVCSVRQLQAPFQRAFSRFPVRRLSGVTWNFDRLLNRHLFYPAFLRKAAGRFDLFHIVDHSYAHLANQLPAERTVVTCHDLDTFRCLLAPEIEPRPRWFRYLVAGILRGMQRAAHVLFVSHSIREQALGLGLVKREKTSVVGNGVDPVFRPSADPAADQRLIDILPAGIEGPLLLHVGSTIPRKRIDVLLEILAAVSQSESGARLIRVGGPLTPGQRELAVRLGVEQRITELPFVSRDVLAAVYRRAAVLLQPSEAEGFGLPVVEAMACGCPVIASDLEVLREVGGEAAIYCATGDIGAWSGAVRELLLRRAAGGAPWVRRAEKLAAQAAGYSWQRTAREAVAVYRQMLAPLL